MKLETVYRTRGKSPKIYNEAIITFDIETTSLFKNSDGSITNFPKELYHKVKHKNGTIEQVHDDYTAMGCMYHWQFCINGDVVTGRTMKSLKAMFKDMQEQPGIKIVWVHNLSFEFHWLNNIFYDPQFGHPNLEVFSREPHKVMKATWGTIEFRCTYYLTNMSLAKAAKEFRVSTQKAQGDLDYEKLRGYSTPLTHEEKGYCRVDVVSLYQIVLKFIEIYKRPDRIPLTSTGRLRRECQQIMHDQLKVKNEIKKAYPDLELYYALRQAFMGGYTHSNYLNTGFIIENVDGFDIASSYPTVMVSEKFPMAFHKDEELTYKLLSADIAYLYKVKITDIKPKNTNSYLSSSRCLESYNTLIDNGRIKKCDYIIGYFTDIDVKIIRDNYNIGNIEVLERWSAPKKYLPKALLEYIFKLYEKKTTLKDVVGQEDSYAQSKAFINSMYGMTVTNDIRDEVEFSNGEFIVKPLSAEEIEKQLKAKKNSQKTFLLYQWGVWVTAYARRNLWYMISKLDSDLVYADTDSTKIVHPEKHIAEFEQYNAMVQKSIEWSIKVNNLNVNYPPKDSKGRERPMGVYEHEEEYPVPQFKTLGAKKYAYIDKEGKMHITVSGVSKSAAKYVDGLDDFEEGKVFTPSQSGRMISHYIYDQEPFKFTDYLGNEQVIDDQPFAICLEPTTYELGLTDDYKALIQGSTHISLFGE